MLGYRSIRLAESWLWTQLSLLHPFKIPLGSEQIGVLFSFNSLHAPNLCNHSILHSGKSSAFGEYRKRDIKGGKVLNILVVIVTYSAEFLL